MGRRPPLDRQGQGSDPIAELEARIQRAANYVHPSDDLRPRTLEAARERGSHRRGQRRALAAMLACLLMAALPLVEFCKIEGASETFVSGSDLHREAQRSSLQRRIDSGWALCEAFRLQRLEQAARLGAEVPQR